MPSAPHPDRAKPLDPAVLEQAADWFARLGDAGASAQAQQDWQRWHDASPANRAAWQRVQSVGRLFDLLPPEGHPAAHQALAHPATARPADRTARSRSGRVHAGQRRRSLKALAMLGAAGLAGWFALRTEPWHDLLATHGTGIGERQRHTLADASTLWLNTATSVDVTYSHAWRRIRVRKGEILVQTHPDSPGQARPFVVDTRHGRLLAVGTRFMVRDAGAFTLLSVLDGAVQIQPVGGSGPPSMILRGQAATFDERAVLGVQAADESMQAWHNGLLIARQLRLGDFVAELSRYRRGQLVCDPTVADLRVVGTYRLDDTEAVLALLQSTLPIRVQRTLPWRVAVVPR